MIEYKNIKSIKNTKNINHINNMNTIVTVVVLGIVFVSLTMASWLLPPQEFSDSERRKLAFKWKSPPPVQRVARDAGCKPLLPDSVSRRPRLSLRSSHYRT